MGLCPGFHSRVYVYDLSWDLYNACVHLYDCCYYYIIAMQGDNFGATTNDLLHGV